SVRQTLREVKVSGRLDVLLLTAQSFSLLLAAFALRCRVCSSYLHKRCKHKAETCVAKDGESCIVTRMWTPPGSVSNPIDGHSGCQINCTEDEYDYSGQAVLTNCCSSHDFCNDITVPTDDWY
ncbi:hypothetical protein LEMLEM_LOCUS23169, partial [Lemmus lemmus]